MVCIHWEVFHKDLASFIVGGSTECLSIVCVQGYHLGLYQGGESCGRASIVEATSSSEVAALIAVSSAKESTTVGRRLVWRHWEGVRVFLGVMSIFPVARLSTH